MPLWLAASAAYFAYVALLTATMRGVAWRGRIRAAVCVAAAVATMVVARNTDNDFALVWILPPILLLLAYWATGALFVAPMAHVERALQSLDDRLQVRERAARTPTPVATFLELAYAGVYPLIPIALGLHIWYADAPDANRFWAVVLITDYICFGTLPWLQTRPPRSLERQEPWRSALRRFNVRMMSTASIRVNTFPSGHAAEALVAALLVLHAPWPWVALMFFSAAAISAGAVLGRYHYAVDAVAGWVVAIIVWALVAV